MASPKTIFIVAGGTGGHVFPAKRVAQKFIEEGFKIIWIGTSPVSYTHLRAHET